MSLRDEVDKRLEQLFKTAEVKGFDESIEAKAKLVEAAAEIYVQVPDATRADIAAKLSASLKVDEERGLRYLALENAQDLRRAIAYRRPQPIRVGNDRLLPTDGWLGRYLLYAQENAVPLGFHFWTGVSVLASAARRNIYIDRGNHEVWPNYYLMLIGAPATYKSTAIDMGVDIIARENSFLEQENYPLDRRVRILPNTVTPAMLLQTLKTGKVTDNVDGTPKERWKDSVGLIYNDDIVTLIGKSNFQSDKLLQILTALYNCPSRWKDSAVIRGDFELRNVAITLLGGGAPEWFRTSISSTMFGGGTMSRFHFVARGKSGRVFPKAGFNDPITADDLAYDLLPLTQSGLTTFQLSDEAEKWWDNWYRENEKKVAVDPQMQLYLVRKPIHLLKLSMILALSNDIETRSIGVPDLEWALQLLEIEEQSLPEMFGEFSASESSLRSDYVMTILNNHKGWMRRTTLLNYSFRKVDGSAGLDRVIRDLMDRGLVIEEKEGRVRRYRTLSPSEIKARED
jgi:hypothetical protein